MWTILAGLAGVVITAAVTYLLGRRAKSGTVATSEAADLWDTLRSELARLTTEAVTCRAEMATARAEAAAMRIELSALREELAVSRQREASALASARKANP